MIEIKRALSIFDIHQCGPVYKIEDLEKTSFVVFQLVHFQWFQNGAYC